MPNATVVIADAVQFCEGLADECIDLVVTDPAYESLEKHRKKGTTTRLKQSKSSSNQWFEIFHNDRFPSLMRELYRVLKEGSHFYLYCDCETMFIVKPIAEQAGFKFWKNLVWDKVSLGMGYHYRARHEYIMFLEKGKRRLNDLSEPDVLKVKRVHKGYPTEKPVDLNKILIRQSTDEGALVFDPFAGSGSTGAAALALGRHFIGCDVNPDAVEIARERLSGATDTVPIPRRIQSPLL